MNSPNKLGRTHSILHAWNGTPLTNSEHISVSLVRAGDSIRITVEAPWHGDPPPPGPAGPLDGLWHHEVVEVFIAGPEAHYLEIELGPHGHHLVLQLEGVRNAVARTLPMHYTVSRRGTRWRGEAVLPWNLLPRGPHRMNAHAIHGPPNNRQHASLHPGPGDTPDFHLLERMAPLHWEITED
jgi:hypothetical protein